MPFCVGNCYSISGLASLHENRGVVNFTLLKSLLTLSHLDNRNRWKCFRIMLMLRLYGLKKPTQYAMIFDTLDFHCVTLFHHEKGNCPQVNLASIRKGPGIPNVMVSLLVLENK